MKATVASIIIVAAIALTPTLAFADNGLPIASNDAASTHHLEPVTISPLVNDSDPDGDPLTIKQVSDPVNSGIIEISVDRQSVTYTPSFETCGLRDSFKYTIVDTSGATAVGVVSVDVDFGMACISIVRRVDVTEGRYEVRARVGAAELHGQGSVQFATSDGTAVTGEDFTGAASSVSFSKGEAHGGAKIPIIDDLVPEPDETFSVVFTGAVIVDGGSNIATVTIHDNDSSGVKPCLTSEKGAGCTNADGVS